VFFAYFNCFRSVFLFDSKTIVLDDPRVHAATAENLAAIFSKGYWYLNQDPTLYRPLTTLSYLFNYAILGNGANPAAYHWVNILLHIANVLLLYALGRILFRRTAPALMLAAVWAVHPVLTEAVTNIVGRADLLAALGVLAGLLCHIRASAATGGRRAAWLLGLSAAAAIAVFSKESGVVLILLMLLYDAAFRPASWRAALPGYAAAALPAALFFYMRTHVLAALPAANTLFVNNPLLGAGFVVWRLTAIQVIGRYLWLLLWPATLSCDYSYNQIPLFQGTFHNWADWATVLSLAVCLAAAALAVWCWRKNKPAFFCIGLFFIALAPASNLAMRVGTIMAERLLYLPAAGFLGCLVLALCAAIARLEERSPGAEKRILWALGIVCAALCLRTQLRNSDWQTGRALWGSAASAAPRSYKTHQNLAVELFGEPGGIGPAIAEDEKALAILHGLAPAQQDPLPYVDAGAHLRAKGDAVRASGIPDAAAQAAAWYRKSLLTLQEGEQIDRAVAQAALRANRAAGRRPGPLGQHLLYQELAQSYLRLGRPIDAVQAIETGLGIELTPEFFQLLSEAYTQNGDRDSAAVALFEGATVYPDRRAFPSELLKLYENWGTPVCAIERTASGTNLNPACPLVHQHFCTAAARAAGLYARRGETGEAEKVRIAAVQSLGCPAP